MRATLIGVIIFVLALYPATVGAAPQGKLNQVIGAGLLTTDIVDATGASVALPSFAMSATTVKTTCQTITGTYGSNTQRVAVDNAGAANAGWNLTIAATGGATAKWTGGSTQYSFNDPAGAGCTTGQLTLDPAAGTLTPTSPGTITGVTKGTAAAFATATPITLLSAAAAADDIWNGYITGIGVSQKIPANTPAGTYTIDLTQTATSI